MTNARKISDAVMIRQQVMIKMGGDKRAGLKRKTGAEAAA
jgi:hypothetical protein